MSDDKDARILKLDQLIKENLTKNEETLKIEVREESDLLIIKVSGGFVLHGENRLQQQIEQLILAAPYKRYIFDLTEIQYVNSQFVGEFFALSRILRSGGARFCVVVSGAVRKYLNGIRADLILNLADTVDDAIRALTTASPPPS